MKESSVKQKRRGFKALPKISMVSAFLAWLEYNGFKILYGCMILRFTVCMYGNGLSVFFMILEYLRPYQKGLIVLVY